MLFGQLEDRFRAHLDGRGTAPDPARTDSIRFATEFAGLLSQMVARDPTTDALASMAASLRARTDLTPPEVELLLDLAMRPEHRLPIAVDDLRVFGARFGIAAEQALRVATDLEHDLAAFTERYGAEEALLLLDALFALCAVDGVIDPDEIGRLEGAARELGIDPMLVSALFRKHDERSRTGELTFPLDGDRVVIGRSASCDVRLPDPLVGDRHCELVRDGQAWRVVDIDSGRPTLLNGTPVASAPFPKGAHLTLGSYTVGLSADGRRLEARGPDGFSALSVRNLSRSLDGRPLLDDISFTVFSGEVVAVVGPSGAGKTTLLNAIAGIVPADTGDVLLDGQDFHTLLAQDPSLVGIVPQEDVVHAELTVEEALHHAARLRFAPRTPAHVLQAEVDRVLDELDLEGVRGHRIGDEVHRGVSGGQRKRVNVGQELLTRTTRMLFLDEPTSGLDPATARDLVQAIRRLADGGRIVFLVTHDLSPALLDQIDHLMVLAPGGRLAWFGPPEAARAYFGLDALPRVFDVLGQASPVVWGERYKAGAAGRTYVRTRQHLLGLEGVEARSREIRPVRLGFWRSLNVLTRRSFRVRLRDRAGTAILLVQAPVLGVAMWWVFPAADVNSLFMLALSSLWFGANASVRELIAERAIWRREARIGLGTAAYVCSKLVVLGFFVGLQCALLALANHTLLDMGRLGFDPFALTGIAMCTGWVGMTLGLAVSALFSTSEAAVGTLPLLLIPQITFGGLLVKVKEMGAIAHALSSVMIVRYSFEALIKTGERLTVPGRRGLPRDPDGRGVAGTLWELGFRGSSDPDDLGLSLVVLLSILTVFAAGFLLVTLWATERARRPGRGG